MAIATRGRVDRNRGLMAVLGAVAILALFLVAAAAAGYHTGIAWMDGLFFHSSTSAAPGSKVTAAGGAGTAAEATCVLNLVCFNPDGSISFGGPSVNAGINANAAAEETP